MVTINIHNSVLRQLKYVHQNLFATCFNLTKYVVDADMKECCWTWRTLNLRPPDHQSDMQPTEPLRPAGAICIV